MSQNQTHDPSSGRDSTGEANPNRASLLTPKGNKKDVHATFAVVNTSKDTAVSGSSGFGGQSQMPSSEPSAIMLISPRTLQSQNYLDDGIPADVHLSTIFYRLDDNTQSTIALRISRGKSQVNVYEPSRINGAGTCPSTLLLGQPGDIGPENQIFPVLEKPFGNVKAQYDFYTPGQTMENVKDKVHLVKNHLAEMKEILVKIRKTTCVLTSGSDTTRKTSDSSDKNNTTTKANPDNFATDDTESVKTITTNLTEDRNNSLSSEGNPSEGNSTKKTSGSTDAGSAKNSLPGQDEIT